MNLPITPSDIEQVFLDFFPDNLSRPDTDLIATFANATEIVVGIHTVDVYRLIMNNLEICYQIRTSNLKDIEYSSGVLMFHQQVGDTIEVDIV